MDNSNNTPVQPAMVQATVYSTPVCGYCKMAKDFFKENGISYDEIDVAASDEKRKELMDKSGQLGVPVILVYKEGAAAAAGEERPFDMVIGFDKKKLTSLLHIGQAVTPAA